MQVHNIYIIYYIYIHILEGFLFALGQQFGQNIAGHTILNIFHLTLRKGTCSFSVLTCSFY